MHTLTIINGKTSYKVQFEGSPTVQQVLESAHITAPHPCGGNGRCGKCLIEVHGEISSPDEQELAFRHRLSCRTHLYGDAVVTLVSDTNLQIETATEDLNPSIATNYRIGAAVDIGTTTVVLSVYDLRSGICLASESMLNPQSTVAADVVGRISHALDGGLIGLQESICTCIRTLAQKSGYAEQIDKWCITGNTTMLYLLRGLSPDTLAVAPFMTEHLFGEEIMFCEKPAYLPPCIHAFIGADITCALLTADIHESNETVLLCDLGTNGEIVLKKNGKYYATSTAAGPVFEGYGISCGCQSVPGAIESIAIVNNTLQMKTIGDCPPVGLCGSGVIDAVACLLNLGFLDETGSMEEESFSFCDDISITRKDISNVQLAKAAIAAGIRTLLEVTETSLDEIKTFYIAGGFGTHLNPDSAVRIGLFPRELKPIMQILGNAALKGAAMLLTDNNYSAKASEIVSHTTTINLGGNPKFNENYINEMFFPEP